MKQFYLLDHSLVNVGGHHYEYTLQILRAAEASRYSIVLGCHEKFASQPSMPKSWNVARLFKHSSYNRYAKYAEGLYGRIERRGLGHGSRMLNTLKEAFLSHLLAPLLDMKYRRGYERISKQYGHSCQQLFARYPPAEGDVIFLPTMSAFDLQCLADYLKMTPARKNVDWHLQFHFNFLNGREPDFPRQENRRVHTAQMFTRALQSIPDFRLHFYSTTECMAAQFQRLGVADFQFLPYPTNPAFRREQTCLTYSKETSPSEEASQSNEAPIHLVCPGHLRKEKGRQQLADFFAGSYEKYFQTGRMQLHLQLRTQRFLQCLPSSVVRSIRADKQQSSTYAPVVHVQHPLNKDQYVQLIRETDIGLLLYDSTSYYARCSGILVEMLTAGVPVIVPAGCWLSEQIAEVNYQHLDRCRENFLSRNNLDEIPKTTLTISDHDQAQVTEISLPRTAKSLMVSFNWVQKSSVGTYVRIEVDQFDSQRNKVDQSSNIEGQRIGLQPVRTQFTIQPETVAVKVTCSNAYHSEPIELEKLEYAIPRMGISSSPAGVVGLTLADSSQVQRRLEEMVEHYDHYCLGAQEFSKQWYQRHAPARTVEILEQHTGSNASFY
jgi:hypothetical protein